MGFEVNNTENQFEWSSKEGTGLLEYAREGDKIHLLLTEVPASMQGQGIATQLVKRSLDYIDSHQLIVVPHCSFVRKFLDNHDEYHHLLSDGYRL